jgi:hypothetical protein
MTARKPHISSQITCTIIQTPICYVFPVSSTKNYTVLHYFGCRLNHQRQKSFTTDVHTKIHKWPTNFDYVLYAKVHSFIFKYKQSLPRLKNNPGPHNLQGKDNASLKESHRLRKAS